MILSMTGFGRGTAVLNGREITVELRSVNSRYFEYSSRIPRSCSYMDSRLKKQLNERVTRGKVELSMTIQNVEAADAEVTVNMELARSYQKALREAHPEIEKTVSATTRAPRPGEQEGVDYYYRTREQFQHLIDTDQVVEHNFYNGNYYGTLREEVDKRLEAGKLVVLVIDVHGAANIRRMFPGATTIFLLPPSVEELERRLRGRGTETEASILERLDTAKKELAEQEKFTLTLVNDEVDACAEKLYGIIRQRAGLDR